MEGDFITAKIHHGGSFSKEGKLSYNGGEVTAFRKIDTDTISYFEIVDMAKEVGSQDGDEFFYTIPGFDLENGIDILHDDESVRKMVNYAKKSGFIDLYVKHHDAQAATADQRFGPASRPKPEEEAHPTSQPIGGGDAQTQYKNNPSAAKQGRKRVYLDDDGLETGLINVSNSIAKYLDAEKENANTMTGIGKALVHGVEVQKQASENKIQLFEVLKKLPGLDMEQVVMAVRIIGRDPKNISLFLTMEDPYKVVFVKQELEAAKKNEGYVHLHLIMVVAIIRV